MRARAALYPTRHHNLDDVHDSFMVFPGGDQTSQHENFKVFKHIAAYATHHLKIIDRFILASLKVI